MFTPSRELVRSLETTSFGIRGRRVNRGKVGSSWQALLRYTFFKKGYDQKNHRTKGAPISTKIEQAVGN